MGLETRVAEALTQRGLTLSTAESCTGGGLSHALTDVPGASAFFIGGVIAYQNHVKTTWLDVPESTLSARGAVSTESAEAMARGCRARFGTDLAVAITGIAGPTGGTAAKPVGLVYLAVASEEGVRVLECHFVGSRRDVRSQSIATALGLILETLGEPT